MDLGPFRCQRRRDLRGNAAKLRFELLQLILCTLSEVFSSDRGLFKVDPKHIRIPLAEEYIPERNIAVNDVQGVELDQRFSRFILDVLGEPAAFLCQCPQIHPFVRCHEYPEDEEIPPTVNEPWHQSSPMVAQVLVRLNLSGHHLP